MEMAIAAKVDGIIVEGNQSAEMKELIDRAEAENITVVTMMHDVADSKRKTFVGINTYALGEMYGNQVVDALQKKNGSTDYSEGEPKVVILTDSSKFNQRGVVLLMPTREVSTLVTDAVPDACRTVLEACGVEILLA